MSDPSASSQPPPPGSQLQQTTSTQAQEAPSSSSGTVAGQPESDSANNIAPSSAQPDTIDPASGPVDAEVDNDIDMTAPENSAAGNGTAGAAADAPGNPVAGAPTSKKESSLREFLGKMDEYAPIVCWDAFFWPSSLFTLTKPSPTMSLLGSQYDHLTNRCFNYRYQMP